MQNLAVIPLARLPIDPRLIILFSILVVTMVVLVLLLRSRGSFTPVEKLLIAAVLSAIMAADGLGLWHMLKPLL